MKIAPLYHALSHEAWARPVLIHTGQHYDKTMSHVFFKDLDLPKSHVHLGVGSGTHAQQTAGVMLAYERECVKRRPDMVIVVGDVNSTMACAIVAKKLCLPLGHLEAGLRSRDRTMPEEINRLVTDALSDILWTPSPDADENLRKENVPARHIVRVGNIMMDSYEMLKAKILSADFPTKLGLGKAGYGVITLHRPSNVDVQARLKNIVFAFRETAKLLPLVFTVHPRTKSRLKDFGLWKRLESPGIHVLPPLGYVDFMSLMSRALCVITDSGGIQEETTYLKLPCLTLRDNTERPVTTKQGSNRLVKPEQLRNSIAQILHGSWPTATHPKLWDGQTAKRVVRSIAKFLKD